MTQDDTPAQTVPSEAVIVREACRRATPQDIETLRRNIEDTARAMADGRSTGPRSGDW